MLTDESLRKTRLNVLIHSQGLIFIMCHCDIITYDKCFLMVVTEGQQSLEGQEVPKRDYNGLLKAIENFKRWREPYQSNETD